MTRLESPVGEGNRTIAIAHRRTAFLGRGGVRMDIGAAPADNALYEQFYPYHAELCALSEIRKKPGFGVPLRSGMGGHSLLYLSGVCLDRRVRYPVLKLCDPGASPVRHGVGISVNSHYKNANWVAVEGWDFFWRGALEPGERLTRAAYERTQDRAKSMGMLDGVEFHDHLFREKPAGMSERDYKYEISAATDYAVRFGRDIFRARVPLDRPRMAAIVAFLNDLNAPYRDGAQAFRWRVFNNNCSHVVHNALASAGVWAPWPTGQFVARAAFNFPVPKNEFVDLVQRTNNLPVQDAQAMYEDGVARRALLETGALPSVPGALAVSERAIADNDLYDTECLRLIFFDHPFFGPYHRRLVRIFNEPRYFDLRMNLRHFATLYAAALERRPVTAAAGASNGAQSGERAQFYMRYDDYIEREAAKVSRQLADLDRAPQVLAEAVS